MFNFSGFAVQTIVALVCPHGEPAIESFFALISIVAVAWFKRSALVQLRDHVNAISTIQLGKGWDFTLTVITSLILLTTLSMTVFNLIKNGYDTYSMSLQGVFGWGSVIFCAVVAIVLSKMKDR